MNSGKMAAYFTHHHFDKTNGALGAPFVLSAEILPAEFLPAKDRSDRWLSFSAVMFI